MSLHKTVAFVTGGASGLGAAAVRALVQQGAKVLVGDLVLPSLSSSPDLPHANTTNPNIQYCHVDVTQPETITAALDLLSSTFGVSGPTAVINSAGIATAAKTINKKGKAHATDSFVKSFHVNTLGSFHVARLSAERMATLSVDNDSDDGLRGCIIQTASIAAYEGQVGQVAYAASKAAIVGMTLPMARDLAPLGIRVVTIAPGLFATPLLDELPDQVKADLGATVPCPNRLGHPDEYGKLVVHILENPMLNGTTIRLDGALRMPP